MVKCKIQNCYNDTGFTSDLVPYCEHHEKEQRLLLKRRINQGIHGLDKEDKEKLK